MAAIKDGELMIFWGRETKHDEKDVVFEWKGDPSMNKDSVLLYRALTKRSPSISGELRPSLLDELKARGYDLSTIKFSIMKKQEG